MRLILKNSKEKEVSLEDELEVIELYLQMESMRFKKKFSYQISVDDQIDKKTTMIQPMLIQPYVENSIWHGFQTLEGEAGILKIDIEKRKEFVFCIIDDNGVGRAASALQKNKSDVKRKSMGMQITSKRLELNLKSKSSIEIIDKKNNQNEILGTRIILKLPFIIKE